MSKAGNIIGIKTRNMSGVLGASKYYKSDWKLVAYLIPRQALGDSKTLFNEPELMNNSIYFLVGNQDGKEKIYVGRAEKRRDGLSVIPRLREHTNPMDANYGFWNYAIAITNEAGLWGATEIHELAYLFYNLIPKESRTNKIAPSTGGDAEEDYEEKVRQITSFLTAMGVETFSDGEDTSRIQIQFERDSDARIEDIQNGLSAIPEFITPKRVVDMLLDSLPEKVWNPYTTFLDPACKGGEFLRAIYERLMKTESLMAMYPDEVHRALHILNKQVFGIALSNLSKDRATRKLMGFDRNVITVPEYLGILKGKDDEILLDGKIITFKERLEGLFGRKNMNFDVVISNPPYQETVGGGNNDSGAKPLFNLFIESALRIIDNNTGKVCMITPTKWIAGTNKEMVSLREKLVNGDHLASMVDFPRPTDLFKGVAIAGGVSYFNYDREYNGKCKFTTVSEDRYTSERDMHKFDIIPRHGIGDSVIEKVLSKSNDFIYKYTSKNKWGFPTNYSGNTSGADSDIKVVTPSGVYYASERNIRDKDAWNNYKVMFSRAVADSAGMPDRDGKFKIFSSIKVLNPGEICNASYMTVSHIVSKEYAVNIEKYLTTKFVRFLVLQTLYGIGFTVDRFRFVPLQDFRLEWTDEALYEKYGLTNEEIEYIEKTIKSV